MYRSLKISTTIIILLVSYQTFGQKLKCYNPQADTIKFAKFSLADLKINPGKYAGRWIETEGIYYCGFEYSTIGLLQKLNSKAKPASFWIEFDNKINCFSNTNQFNEIKVLLRGKMNLDNHGHLSNYDAAIDNVYYIEQL